MLAGRARRGSQERLTTVLEYERAKFKTSKHFKKVKDLKDYSGHQRKAIWQWYQKFAQFYRDPESLLPLKRGPKKNKYLAALLDDATRITYCEKLPDKKAKTLALFLRRASEWFQKRHGIIFKKSSLIMAKNSPLIGKKAENITHLKKK